MIILGSIGNEYEAAIHIKEQNRSVQHPNHTPNSQNSQQASPAASDECYSTTADVEKLHIAADSPSFDKKKLKDSLKASDKQQEERTEIADLEDKRSESRQEYEF